MVLHIDFETAILALERPWHVVFVPHISEGLFICLKIVRIVSGFFLDMRNLAVYRQYIAQNVNFLELTARGDFDMIFS